MSHRFYSDPITRCKRRKTWMDMGVWLLAVLALALLTGWLWAVLLGKATAAVEPRGVSSGGCLLAEMDARLNTLRGKGRA